ncbi:MAG: hypothetical protein IJ776_03890 [Paludibacteraceae bacterium]|nr:hypothetical protein [Paludibacteraceae bacterium]
MKKNLLFKYLPALLMLVMPPLLTHASAQSTEGSDFWVTFLQGDNDDSGKTDDGDPKRYKLSLSISARETAEVTIENKYYGYSKKITVGANSLKEFPVFDGIANDEQVRSNRTDYSATSRANGTARYCYSYHPEMIDSCALHVSSDKPISLFASNYKIATFDATNVLPTDALLKEYIIQCYTPSDHGGSHQGSHFAIIAVEDNTEVEYTPTVLTLKNEGFRTAESQYKSIMADPFASQAQKDAAEKEWEKWKNFKIGETTEKVTLQKGQVYYVWTGTGDNESGHDYDLSGTHVKANKKIAVFQGNPHTNLPYYKDYGETGAIRERDHLFSQAMPTGTWGNTFALTGSSSRHRDIVRVMALNDGTEVRINGKLMHTFDFNVDKKQYWEFEFGDKEVTGDKKTRPEPTVTGSSCFVETSCPCAVHSFIVSRRWDGPSDNNGDPAMLWINPIEQKIDQITFATYASELGGSTQHYVNVVTEKENAGRMKLDGVLLTGFADVAGSGGKYQFVQKSLGNAAATHTLLLEGAKEGEGFIASIYGLTKNESYGYNAGGAAKVLTQEITINGEVFTTETDNLLCGKDTITFTCNLNYDYEGITWNFGDGSPALSGTDSTKHFYEKSGLYHAYVMIQRSSSNVCAGQSLVDTVPITVNVGRFEFEIGEPEEAPCKKDEEARTFRVPFNNISGTSLDGDNVHIGFNQQATDDGFTQDDLEVEPDMFIIEIPETATAGVSYGINIRIQSDNDCGDTDTTLYFRVNYEADDILVQRFDNVLGLLQAPFEGDDLSDFHWYKDSVLMEEEHNAVLYTGTQTDTVSEYYVCFTINKGTAEEVTTCSCPRKFKSNNDTIEFETEGIKISATSATAGTNIYVNSTAEAEARWISIDGTDLSTTKLPEGGGLVEVPKTDKAGLYILRVITGKQQRNFKFIIL